MDILIFRFQKTLAVISFLFFIISFPFFSKTNDNKAKEYLKSAKTFIKNKKYNKAVDEVKKAEKLSPKDGYYSYFLGDIYREHLKDYKNAVDSYQGALKKGYKTNWVYHKMGVSYYELKKYKSAIDMYYKSIELLRAERQKLYNENKKDQAEKLNGHIADRFKWLNKVIWFVDREGGDIIEDGNKLFEISKYYLSPGWKNKSLIREKSFAHANACEILGDYYFGESNYDKALFYYKEGKKTEDQSGYMTNYHKSWRFSEIIDIVKKRKKLGKIKPEYVHQIMIIYVRNSTTIFNSGKIINEINITDTQKKSSMLRQDTFREVIETMSNGKLSLSFQHIDLNSIVYEGQKFPRDHAASLEADYELINKANDYDTYIIVSTDASGRAGYGYYPYVPYIVGGRRRGWVRAGAGYAYNWRMWFHEFFHVIERIAAINPGHGWGKNGRKKFPDWKGETELDYYNWHFQNTLIKKSWQDYNFRLKYPEDKIIKSKFDKLLKIYENISVDDRIKALELVREGNKYKKNDIERAVSFYKKALKISPYDPGALAGMAYYYHHIEKKYDKALYYYEKLILTKPEKESDKLLKKLEYDFK